MFLQTFFFALQKSSKMAVYLWRFVSIFKKLLQVFWQNRYKCWVSFKRCITRRLFRRNKTPSKRSRTAPFERLLEQITIYENDGCNDSAILCVRGRGSLKTNFSIRKTGKCDSKRASLVISLFF